MALSKPLSSSQEDYLEAILRLVQKNRVARVKDIAEALGVRMPSVTSALKQLKERQMIRYEKNSFITLTDEGAACAAEVDERHRTLVLFLESVLMVQEAEAETTACRIEHAIGMDISRRIGSLTENFTSNFVTGDKELAAWKKIMNS
jgi:DtxR family Mn-dependent transcriptional regulator